MRPIGKAKTRQMLVLERIKIQSKGKHATSLLEHRLVTRHQNRKSAIMNYR
jgi:hypothetical protein